MTATLRRSPWPLASALFLLLAAAAFAPGLAARSLDELVAAHRSVTSVHALLHADPVDKTGLDTRAVAGTWRQVAGTPAPAAGACPPLLQHTFVPIQGGAAQSLCQYQGKVLLVVNTASQCGFTNQYEGLEALYRKYRERGLVVVGFPSDDFGGQEPGSNKEIAEFCRTKFGVQFPMFEKPAAARLADNPLYVALRTKTGEAPRWNFHKYVVDRSGQRVQSFRSSVEPGSRDLVTTLERLLAERAGDARS